MAQRRRWSKSCFGTILATARGPRYTGRAIANEDAQRIASAIEGEQLSIYSGGYPARAEVDSFASTLFPDPATATTPWEGGFRTILFTDLEASTPLTQHLGDEGAQELLRGHSATVRTALTGHGGREVKHTGWDHGPLPLGGLSRNSARVHCHIDEARGSLGAYAASELFSQYDAKLYLDQVLAGILPAAGAHMCARRGRRSL